MRPTVRLSFDYAAAQSASVRVVAVPMSRPPVAPDAVVRGARWLSPGRGSGTAEFTLRKGPASTDGMRVQMFATQQTEVLFETKPRVRYTLVPPTAATPSVAAKVQIPCAQSERTGSGIYEVAVSGGVSGPEQVTLFVGVTAKYLPQPSPVLEIDCGQWQGATANGCTRADAVSTGTRWVYRRSFASSQPPTHAIANLYDGPNPESATRIAEHRFEFDCR